MSWDRPMLLGWESYAGVIHERSPVPACKCAACDLVFQTAFPMKHLQPAPCCALQVASKKLRRKKGGLKTSHLNELGGPCYKEQFPPHILLIRVLGPMEWRPDFLWDGTPHELDVQACTLASCNAVPYLLGRNKKRS